MHLTSPKPAHSGARDSQTVLEADFTRDAASQFKVSVKQLALKLLTERYHMALAHQIESCTQ